jgi:hypothetical protein
LSLHGAVTGLRESLFSFLDAGDDFLNDVVAGVDEVVTSDFE